MTDRNAKTFKSFHKVMVNFILWLFAAAPVIIGGLNIYNANMNGAPMTAVIIAAVLLFGSSILLVKARFDLKNGEIRGATEILIAGFIIAAAFLIDWLAVWPDYGSVVENSFLYPLIAACWGISIYRYYMMHRDEFADC
jgi:heme/copper-type cytochrome/quinol oxidase subunit 3